MENAKYVVFKRQIWEDSYENDQHGFLEPIEDAVVIRLQDVFAAPALWTYAHCIALAGSLLKAGDDPHGDGLLKIADYFSEMATLAAESKSKIPD